jgi:hypothetical protein
MHYLKVFVAASLMIISSVGAFNWFIDPFGFFWSPAIEGVNLRKTQADEHVREVTPYRAEMMQPEVVIVGNSRTQVGLAAESSVFKDDLVYNLSLPGASLPEELKHGLYQLAHNNNIKQLFIALDYRYFLHNYELTPKAQSKEQLLATLSRDPETVGEKCIRILPRLFSIDGLIASVKTLGTQQATGNVISRQGSNSGDYYLNVIQTEGKKRFIGQQLRTLKEKFARDYLDYRVSTAAENYNIALLRAFLQQAREISSANITLFINPYHLAYWHIIDDTGHWSDYLQWKRDLVMVATEFPEYQFWDFSLWHEYTTEPLNLSEDRTPMAGYWEIAHYRHRLGDAMIRRMLGTGESAFGVNLEQVPMEYILSESNVGLQNTSQQWHILKLQLGVE